VRHRPVPGGCGPPDAYRGGRIVAQRSLDDLPTTRASEDASLGLKGSEFSPGPSGLRDF
jgi:hypothetical protein